ncbi:MAG: ATP-grasp domain-containing protein [Candidatus Aureabacteria bacterium]|nr:ATP-grasp domain-containing protein [Candidatus Auribacterota bacterium]
MNSLPYQHPAILYNQVPGETYRHDDDKVEDSTVRDFIKALHPVVPDVFCVPYPFTLPDMMALLEKIRDKNTDFIINFCEEANGISHGEAWIAGILELLNIPYSGSPAETLIFCLDKFKTSIYLKSLGIAVPESELIESDQDLKTPSCVKIIKPCCEDGSVGLVRQNVCRTLDELKAAYKMIRKQVGQRILIEDYIEGREINVSILDGETLPLSEIDYSNMKSGHPHILTYEAKWQKRSEAYIGSKAICPAKINSQLEHKIIDMALHVYHAMRLRHYGRVDFRVDHNDNPYVIDVNPNPCLSPDAGFVRALKQKGWDYKKMIEIFFRK